MLALSGKVIVLHGSKRGPALKMHAKLLRLKCDPYKARPGRICQRIDTCVCGMSSNSCFLT